MNGGTLEVTPVDVPTTSTTNGGTNTSSSETIKIFARIRPCKEQASSRGSQLRNKTYRLDGADPGEDDEPQLHFNLPKDQAQGLINNSRENYDFWFNRVFDQDTSQQEVFDTVAKDVVDNVFDGYNGTIFAYGQTGSGKTYTITGGPRSYNDRGLIPRSVQYLFKRIREDKDTEYTVNVSYLEIYNESGYDLLDSSRDYKKLEDLPKVTIQEDSDEHVHLRNLGSYAAQTEEDALNLLFIGDTNKMIAETPSNPASSRSHCLFVLTLVGRRAGEDRVRRSKLHLVDLAGSERVSRTKIDGTTLKEAKYINLSLHYLEQVIVALHEKAQNKRVHIPYRNSMMTTILRDSLGGNCKTSMIATLAVEQPLIEETMSTARFAQRVALIRNEAMVNEELDLRFLVDKLRKQVESLKSELAIARGGEYQEGPLADYEKERVRQAVDTFVKDPSPHAQMLMTDFRKIQEAFVVMKTYINEARERIRTAQVDAAPEPKGTIQPVLSREACDTEYTRLRQQIAQRDSEISVLVSMLKKQESGAVVEKTMTQEMVPHISSARSPSQTRANAEPPVVPHSEPAPALTVATAEPAALPETSPETVTISSAEKTAAFLEFRRSYAGGTMIDEQKLALKQKYAQAKALGEEANGHRQAVTAIKVRLEKVTMQNMMIQGIGQKPDTDLVHEEQQLREDMDVKRTAYKNAFNRLKELKQEIEHMQHLVENARIKMQRDFEAWLVEWKSRGPVERAGSSMAQGSMSVAPQQTEVKNLELPSMVIPVIKSAWNKPTAPVAITEMASSINHRSRPSSSKDHRVSLSAMSSSTATKFTASTNDDVVSSVLSRAGAVLTDKSVEQEIAAFYKARDAVRAAGRCASRNM